ncbi:MAG: phospholipase D family protein [ANME-2 cluster archaeon]|jgi:phosphatidylserine/phosphatidylglycerophosphate/cardiolipin synthase-like enzyme|nr:phospholipase D family protein [ANME-2 cluster archaeon]
MAEFLTTTGISYELEKLIKNSEEKLFLVSPYLQIADSLKHLIMERDLRKIDIRVVYRKDNKINAEDMSFLQELTSVKIYAHENLHAKCYLNENTAIIASMNLYQYSQVNNREMGIKIEKEMEPELYNDISKEVMIIIQTSQEPEFSVKKLKKEEPVISKKAPIINRKSHPESNKGFCIRCGTNLKLNPEKPLCFNCYKSWEKYGNSEYKEKFCHVCGKESTSTVEKPVCYSCYKKAK